MEQTGADESKPRFRKGGHIETSGGSGRSSEDDAALNARGKRILIAATSIARADEPDALGVLKTLKAAGITYYRMSHYQLKLGQPLLKQVRNFAGRKLGAAGFDAKMAFKVVPESFGQQHRSRLPGSARLGCALMLEASILKRLGLAFDTRHLCKDTVRLRIRLWLCANRTYVPST